MSFNRAWLALAWLLGCFALAVPAVSQTVPSPVGAPTGEGKVFLTMDEALRLAFPKAQVRRTTAYLSSEQQKAIQKACGASFTDRVVYPYVAVRDGKVVGTAYFDTHRVRSLRQTLMVVVDEQGKIARVELLAFAEPRKYQPQPKWLRQFFGARLNSDLRLGGRIRPMSGATLTAKATLECSRRILALHAELAKRVPEPETKDPTPKKETKDPPAPKPSEGTDKKDPDRKKDSQGDDPKPAEKPPTPKPKRPDVATP